METKTVTIYEFNELDEKTQQKVIDGNRDINVDSNWWEFVYEDARHAASLIGIDIKDIYFSGFSSQGDGACFVGTYHYESESIARIKEEFPSETVLHNIAESLEEIQRKHNYELESDIHKNGIRYEHENTVDVDTFNTYSGDGVDIETDDTVSEELKRFMRWIYSRLENEYTYLTSDDAVREMIGANGFLFTRDGEIWRDR